MFGSYCLLCEVLISPELAHPSRLDPGEDGKWEQMMVLRLQGREGRLKHSRWCVGLCRPLRDLWAQSFILFHRLQTQVERCFTFLLTEASIICVSQ